MQPDHKVWERILLITYKVDFRVLRYPYGGDPDLSPVPWHTGETLRQFDSPMFGSGVSGTVGCRRSISGNAQGEPAERQ